MTYFLLALLPLVAVVSIILTILLALPIYLIQGEWDYQRYIRSKR
jgi:hypothetical protein